MKYLFIVSTLLVSFSAYATEGSKPYTPSRLEWLAMEMNIASKTEYEQSGISMAFVGIENKNEILIYVRYLPNADREILNNQINNAKELIRVKAQGFGWSDWLRIREDVQMDKPKSSE